MLVTILHSRWLDKQFLGCTRPADSADSFSNFEIPSMPDAVAASWPKGMRNGVVISVEADGWSSGGNSAAEYCDRARCDAASTSTVEAELEAEVDAIIDTLAASGIFVPDLDPRGGKQGPHGAAAALLHQSTYSSTWLASLQAPGAGCAAGDSSKPQRMIIKAHAFYSEQRAAKALVAAARSGKAVHVPTERDAMHEVRSAVKASLASTSTSLQAASSLGISSSSSSALGQPVHVEVRPCAQRSSSGPDFEVVALYPYHPAAAAASDVPTSVIDDDAPSAQQRIQMWLCDSE
ncbi:hypothetical protein PLESTB_000599500 [Pleodorina starrii]|uniref:Uncharacterized protein n=1 Tax=Pleodorina starrii TaxID=330485 RepID=A0A9W6BHD7_9CHLO|nr:hypothetical protein PLESTB_000599500 [Pleodorina starrii]